MSPRLKYRPGSRVPSFSMVILVGIAVVLSILAWLQYGWITEVSDAEKDRLEENLTIAATRFAQDFDGEMRLLVPFRRPGPGPGGPGGPGQGPGPRPNDFNSQDTLLERLTLRYDQWAVSSQHTDLVRDLFAAEVVAPGDVRLFRYNPNERALEPIDWPAEFSDFHKNVIDESVGRRPNLGRGGFSVDRADLQDVPALAIPVLAPGRPPAPGERGRGFRQPSPRGWEIIRLDGKYFNEVFLPALVQRHFAKQGDFDYDIVIAQASTGNVVYRSSPDLDLEDFKKAPDTRIRLTAAGFSGGPQRGPRGGFGGDGPPGAQNNSGWELYAKHHIGSLQSFADRFRARNLAISFGIFTILAIGIAFTILSSERVRQIGRLQLEFAAGLSHELRTPLAVIRSAGYNLASGKIGGSEEVARYGKLLQEEGLRLSDMVEQALLFAQTQSGRNRYQRNPVDLTEVLNKAVRSCQAILPKYPGEIKVEAEPNLPLAYTDADAINHCLHNLLVNALKYGPSPGYVTVTATPDLKKSEPEVAIAVVNRGSVIDALDLQHLFEPFFRGKNTDGVPGSGLGLYIVKSVMESLGGSVTVASSEAEGTRFILHIPAIVAAQEA
jgi:signal transduction histidine kinase